MLINLTDVLSCDGKVAKRTVETELTSFDSASGCFPLTVDEPLALTLTNLGEKKLRIEGSMKVTATIPCDRCLTDVQTPIAFDLDTEIDMSESGQNRIDDLDETDYIADYELDTDRLIQGELLLNWPMKILCREDCKGICRKCGQNLNLADCGCDTVELDPRMAVIAEIFKKNSR